MLEKPGRFSLRGEIMILVVCVALAITLLVLPQDTQITVADRLGQVLTFPYWEMRNFSEDIVRTQEQNTLLKQQLVELKQALATGARMSRDAMRMAGPAVAPGYEGEIVPCRVVMRQRGRFATMLKIRSLTPVDWQPWLPVISRRGYLGRLHKVINDQEAWVELMTVQDFAMGAELDRTGLLGILRPRAGHFVLEMVGRDEDVRVGDQIITSGIAEVKEQDSSGEQVVLTPRGFPVGRVIDVSSPLEQLFKVIIVEPDASFDYNETVFVITPLNEASGREGSQ